METNIQTPGKGAYTGSSRNALDASERLNKQIFIEEQKSIFKNVWVPVCHESELPEPYDFRTSSIGNDNVLICRAPDGKINALLNVCPHRAMLIERRPRGSFLEGQASGNPKRITCMFHAWQFDMRGNCVYVAREKEGYQDRFCKDDAGLRRLRCSVNFGGFVWVNMNDQPVATLEEWVGDAFLSLEGHINSTPLEVVHYRKEFIDTGLKARLLKMSDSVGAHSKQSLFNFGHFMTEDSKPGADKNEKKNSFPTPNAMQSIRVNLFPGFSFHLDGPTLNVSTVTPVNGNRLMIEHKSLAPQGERETERNTRSQFYNANFGPFRAMEQHETKTEKQNEEKKQALANHLLHEWSRWMDEHPDGESRLSELATRRSRNAILDKDEDLIGPKVVVIGASHAGIAFADRLRKNGFTGKIAVFDRQVGGPMERPPLSKGFLLGGGETVESKSLLRQKKWYKTNKVRLNTQTSVQAIDTERKTVTVNNGDMVNYDMLVIACGAIPRELPATVGMGNSFTLRQPADANAIRQAANNADSVIIIGGGYIGLEVAASLRKKGIAVTVIEAASRILARVASQPLADHLVQLHRDNGVTVLTDIGVDKINKEDGRFDSVILSNGEKIKADMLITGIGVFPDSKLASDAGIETQRADGGAILVDDMMRTSDGDVYAIGDVAIRRDQALAVESVHNAQETASIAAAAITKTDAPTIQTPWFWSDQYDTKLQSVGIVPVQDEEVYQVVRPSKRDHGISFWSYKGSELVAVEVVNDPATYMEARQCLDTNRSPDPNQISSLSYSPIDSGGGRSQ
jgi:NADPH-dependent 2,4-dienoyl-CoA reductase/sulfur reductase-like enzyme/nitrite reductase/ring-hydroxylating ferredoxin subunit